NKPTTQYPSTPGFISNHWYGRWGQVISTLAFQYLDHRTKHNLPQQVHLTGYKRNLKPTLD
ncbi:hypothetical protein, partial [Xanthomonas campestris]|uniref:hypothetical protein n=1 Tax=Xanthomonas campestris TaxID=339 RepID=UPI002AD3DA41